MLTVSIIMLTYNHEKYVKEAIESILTQKVDFKYEILIGDDSSIDSTPRILEVYKNKYPDKIVLIKRNKNIGPTKNLYDLLKRSKGKYIAYLEGDDYWLDKDKLRKQIELLDNSNYIGIAHGNRIVDTNGNLHGHSIFSNNRKILKMKDLIKSGGLFHTATFVHRNFFLDSKDEYEIIFEAHSMIGDLTLYCLNFDKGDILFIPEVMSAYRVDRLGNGENASTIIRKDYIKWYITIINMHNKLELFFDKKYNFENLKVLRTVELLSNFYLNKSFSRNELNKFYESINFKIKIKAYLITGIRAIKYLIKKLK